MSSSQSLTFDLKVVKSDGSSADGVRVQVGQPVLNTNYARWECRVSWEGAAVGSLRIYGATSIQCLTLALHNLQSEMAATFPNAQITEDGVPWLLEPVSRD